MFHATVGKEYGDAMQSMKYILHQGRSFRSQTAAFSLAMMQATSAVFLEFIFILYTQTLDGTLNIVMNFIAI